MTRRDRTSPANHGLLVHCGVGLVALTAVLLTGCGSPTDTVRGSSAQVPIEGVQVSTGPTASSTPGPRASNHGEDCGPEVSGGGRAIYRLSGGENCGQPDVGVTGDLAFDEQTGCFVIPSQTSASDAVVVWPRGAATRTEAPRSVFVDGDRRIDVPTRFYGSYATYDKNDELPANPECDSSKFDRMAIVWQVGATGAEVGSEGSVLERYPDAVPAPR